MMVNILSPLIDRLESHPRIKVTRKILFPGASEELIQKVETTLNTSLDPSVRSIYKAHNGVVLEWIYKDSEYYDPDFEFPEEETPDILTLFGSEEVMDGRIILFPLEEVFVKAYSLDNPITDFSTFEGWLEFLEDVPEDGADGPYTFDGKTYPSEADFRSRLRYVDFFMPDKGVVMLMEEGNPDPFVYFEPYRGGGWEAHSKMALSRYLQLSLQHYGLTWRRDYFFTYPVYVETDLDWDQRLKDVLDRLE